MEQIVVALKACLLDSRSTPLSHAAPEEIDPETGGSIATLSQILLEQIPSLALITHNVADRGKYFGAVLRYQFTERLRVTSLRSPGQLPSQEL